MIISLNVTKVRYMMLRANVMRERTMVGEVRAENFSLICKL